MRNCRCIRGRRYSGMIFLAMMVSHPFLEPNKLHIVRRLWGPVPVDHVDESRLSSLSRQCCQLKLSNYMFDLCNDAVLQEIRQAEEMMRNQYHLPCNIDQGMSPQHRGPKDSSAAAPSSKSRVLTWCGAGRFASWVPSQRCS